MRKLKKYSLENIIMKKIKNIFIALLIVALPATVMTSCSKNGADNTGRGKGTITIEGVLADNGGVSAEGLTLVLLDENSNDYSVRIGEGGKFTARGIQPGTYMALSVEGDGGVGYTKVSYFKIITSDSVSLGEMQGKNFNGYLSAYCKEDTETLYISFRLDKNNYLEITYLSDECPESETVTVETTREATTRNDVLF